MTSVISYIFLLYYSAVIAAKQRTNVIITICAGDITTEDEGGVTSEDGRG